MARNTKQQTIPEPNYEECQDYQSIFTCYTEMIEQTTNSLGTYLINMDHLLETSEDGAFRLLRLICERYYFIVNDMKRELQGKQPLDGAKLEYIDFTEEYRRKHPYFFKSEGGV